MKNARHRQILDLINEYVIETQEDLAQKLQENGFSVTQATISRDIRELKLTKIATREGHSRYSVLPDENHQLSEKYVNVLRTSFVSAEPALNLLVIRTLSGTAMAAAAALDEINMDEIIGCIAGDNTIMCAARSVDDALVAMTKLQQMLERV